MNKNIEKVNKVSYIALFCLLLAGFSASAQQVTVSTDSLLCESRWVTLTASVTGCTAISIAWQKVHTDNSIVDVDGSEYYHELDGDNLKTKSDGEYLVIANCDDGSALQGGGFVEQETNDNNCR